MVSSLGVHFIECSSRLDGTPVRFLLDCPELLSKDPFDLLPLQPQPSVQDFPSVQDTASRGDNKKNFPDAV